MTILTHAVEVAQTSDFFIGRQMYGRGIPLEDCTSVRMQSGWLTAENIAEWAEFEQLMADRQTPTVEAEFDGYLEAYRAAPVVYLSDEQMKIIEDERPGEDEFDHRMMW